MNEPIKTETEAFLKTSVERFLLDVYPFLNQLNNQINEIEVAFEKPIR